MRKQIIESLDLPEGVSCEVSNNVIKCKKGGRELTKKLDAPEIIVAVEGGKIIFKCESGNRNHFKIIKSQIAHAKNLFRGLNEDYVYKLESANVHFPMTLKIEGNKFIINNFLGEKTPRFAKIGPGVKVDIKGQKITVSSPDKDLAGQTAANLEKATKIKKRDRRVFQDGIYLVERPGGAI